MPLGATFANDLAKLVFQATAIALLADNAGSTPDTQLIVSLHTADPGAAGDVDTNKCAYMSYAPVAVDRDSGGFAVSGSAVTPVADIVFPASTGGADESATHAMISDSTGKQIVRGELSTPILITNGGPAPTLTTSTQINFLTT